jgi:hypothetical protein
MEQFQLPAVEGFPWPPPVYLHQRAEASTWTAEDEAKAAAALTPPKRLYLQFDAWLAEQERLAGE